MIILFGKGSEHGSPTYVKVTFIGFQYEGVRADGVVWLKFPMRCVMGGEAMFVCLDLMWMTQQERINLRYLACQQLLEQCCQALWLRRLVKQVPDRLVGDLCDIALQVVAHRFSLVFPLNHLCVGALPEL